MPTRRTFLIQTAATVATATSTRVAHAMDEAADATTSRAKRKDAVLRLAIIGTGAISHRYLGQAAASNRARFVATCARTIDSARKRAIEYGIDAWFDDYTAMYETIAPDAVVVATPTALHAAPTIAAFERGIHVLCEKPMATTFEDCEAMVAASRKSGTVFLALPFDATQTFLTALNYLNEATLGVFMGAEAQFLIPGPLRDNWFFDRTVAGGGAGLELVYPVSRLISMLGPAHRVTGFVNTLIPHRILGDGKTLYVPRGAARGKTVEPTVDDNATLIVEWPGGQHAVVRSLWGSSIVSLDSTLYGRHGTLWLSGNDVIIHSPERVIPGTTPVTWGNYKKSCYRIPVKEIKNEGLIDHFVDCIEGLSQPTCSGQQQLHVHEILFKGYEAARTGRTQQLETTFTPWHRIDPAFHDTRSRPI